MLAFVPVIPAFEFLVTAIDRKRADIDHRKHVQEISISVVVEEIKQNKNEQDEGPEVYQIAPETELILDVFLIHID